MRAAKMDQRRDRGMGCSSFPDASYSTASSKLLISSVALLTRRQLGGERPMRLACQPLVQHGQQLFAIVPQQCLRIEPQAGENSGAEYAVAAWLERPVVAVVPAEPKHFLR